MANTSHFHCEDMVGSNPPADTNFCTLFIFGMKIDKKIATQTGAGLGLSTVAVIWMMQTFALHRDLIDARQELSATKIELKETRERLLIVDTIVMQKQRILSEKYE